MFLKSTKHFSVRFEAFAVYTLFQSRVTRNGKVINVCFNSSTQGLMVETALKSDLS